MIPGLMKVKGLRILRVSPIHRTNMRGTIRTVRESQTVVKEYIGGGFGGRAGNLGGQRGGSLGQMRTPRDNLKAILDDWQQGGVMVYDTPMDTTNMAYHVMLPVEELIPYMGREFRAPMDGFDHMYQHFIKNGAQAPVYVAVGKNGRIKITGGEDLVWFAKRSGLEELPVFLSYQRQV